MLQTVFLVSLVVVAGVVFLGAIFLILKMDAASQSQGGRVFTAVAAMLLLGWIESKVAWVVRRRNLFSLTHSSEPMHYRVLSVLALLLAAVMLFGCALLLPN